MRCAAERHGLDGAGCAGDYNLFLLVLQSNGQSLRGPLFCADRKGGKNGQRALRPLKTPLYSRICAHRPALLQPSNFNRMA